VRRRIVCDLLVAAATIGVASNLPANVVQRVYAQPGGPATSSHVARVDSLASLLRQLDPKIAPVEATIDSMVGVLRVDSGTTRADSAFLRARKTLEDLVWGMRVYEDSAFQNTAYPHRRTLFRALPTARELAIADSLARRLNERGIWVYLAEGDAYVAVSEPTLFRRLGRFLTEPMREYQRILMDEQAWPTADDASLMISWDKLGERLASTDRFLAAHPGAVARDGVKGLYDRYLSLYLLGTDNTKAFDRRTRVLEFDVHRSYERYVVDHGSTTSGKVVRDYLDLLRRNQFRYGDHARKYLLSNTGWSVGALGPP